jgi:predicted Rossmann fold flavoprotein
MEKPINIIGAGPLQVTCVGAGPAGMTAALLAAKYGAKVRLIDGNEQVGRKLLVTGSGRANLTNQHMDASHYTCADPDWIQTLLCKFGHPELISFFNEIGVLTTSTADGWCYPVSESAQTVVDTFANALRLAGVELVLNTRVRSITNDKCFKLTLDSGAVLDAEHLIVAAGGKAYPTLGSRGELFPSLKALGHTINPLVPALAPVTCEMKPWRPLTGVRMDVRASLFEGSSLLAETTGNLIFTEWGLNGPAVMDLSHHISTRPGAKLELRLNPLFATESDLRDLFKRQYHTLTPVRVLLGAILPPKIAPVVITRAGFTADVTIDQLNDDQIEKLFRTLTTLPFKVTGVRGFEFCQVSSGGVPVSEVDPLNLRSRLVPGLSLAGETLDVVGPCGGYNLQFAFSSGAIAGMGIFD